MNAKINTTLTVTLTMSYQEAEILATLLSLTAVYKSGAVGDSLCSMSHALEEASIPYRTLEDGDAIEAIGDAAVPFCETTLSDFDNLEIGS